MYDVEPDIPELFALIESKVLKLDWEIPKLFPLQEWKEAAKYAAELTDSRTLSGGQGQASPFQTSRSSFWCSGLAHISYRLCVLSLFVVGGSVLVITPKLVASTPLVVPSVIEFMSAFLPSPVALFFLLFQRNKEEKRWQRGRSLCTRSFLTELG